MPGLCSDAELRRNEWPWIGESDCSLWSHQRLHAVDMTAERGVERRRGLGERAGDNRRRRLTALPAQ